MRYFFFTWSVPSCVALKPCAKLVSNFIQRRIFKRTTRRELHSSTYIIRAKSQRERSWAPISNRTLLPRMSLASHFPNQENIAALVDKSCTNSKESAPIASTSNLSINQRPGMSHASKLSYAIADLRISCTPPIPQSAFNVLITNQEVLRLRDERYRIKDEVKELKQRKKKFKTLYKATRRLILLMEVNRINRLILEKKILSQNIAKEEVLARQMAKW